MFTGSQPRTGEQREGKRREEEWGGEREGKRGEEGGRLSWRDGSACNKPDAEGLAQDSHGEGESRFLWHTL